MKAKLLKKTRKRITLVTPNNEKVDYFSKFIVIKIKLPFKKDIIIKSTKNKYYGYYGNALNRQRQEIIDLARKLNKLSKWKLIFY